MTVPLTGREAQGAVPAGWVRLESVDDEDLAVLVEMGDSYPRVTQGYGGWDEVDRRGRIALTTWNGRRPLGIDLPVFFDGFTEPDGLSVEAAITVLEGLAGRGPKHPVGKPPAIKVDSGGVMPFDFKASESTRWVITELAWEDDSTIVHAAGNRLRAAATVSLLEYVYDASLAARAATVQRAVATAARRVRKPHVVKAGETAVSIARDELKDAGRWVEIATINGIRDPRATLRTGTKIKLPK